MHTIFTVLHGDIKHLFSWGLSSPLSIQNNPFVRLWKYFWQPRQFQCPHLFGTGKYFYGHSLDFNLKITIIVPTWNTATAEQFKILFPIFPLFKFVHSTRFSGWRLTDDGWRFDYLLTLILTLSYTVHCCFLHPTYPWQVN